LFQQVSGPAIFELPRYAEFNATHAVFKRQESVDQYNRYRKSLLKATRNSGESLSGLEREAVELLEPVEYEGYVGMADRLVG
jgi:hypothetical protein